MKSSPRALCIVPPTGRYIRESRCQTSIEKLKTVALRPPIDLLYAAAGFERGGCECLLSDYPAEEWGWDQLREQIAAFRPKYLVLEITTPSLDRDLKAADIAKAIDPFLITIAKGAHFNIFDHDTLERYPALDVVMRGEYESACEEMAAGAPFADILGLTWRDASGGIIRNADRPFQNDLDAFPFPARQIGRAHV